MREQIDREQDDRQASLQSWLAYHSVSRVQLARRLGVSPSMITRIIKGERAPARRLKQLMALGVPACLLPEPTSGKPGRPPKKAQSGRWSTGPGPRP